MRLVKETLRIEEGEVRFMLADNAERSILLNMGLGQARDLAEEILLVLLTHRCQEPRPTDQAILDRMIRDAEHLPERIAIQAVACGEEDRGETMVGDRFE